MTTTMDWPTDEEWTCIPTLDELARESRYWADLDRIAEYDAWVEMQAELASFEGWPLEDLLDELETVRTLTPDQEDVIEELVAEIERRGMVAA